MAKRKARAPCRADTRGGAWAGIPVCVIKSPAYRDLSLWARAILVELVARMNGYNNGAIALSVTEICEALRNSNRGKAAKAIAELMEHGFIDVAMQADRRERLAREYRLTFVATAGPPFGAANEYKSWTPTKKSGGNTSSPEKGNSGNASLPVDDLSGNASLPRILIYKRKTAKFVAPADRASGNDASLLISNHTPPRTLPPQPAAGDLSTTDGGAAEPAPRGQARLATGGDLP